MANPAAGPAKGAAARLRRATANAGLPVVLTIVLFLWEGFRYQNLGVCLPAILGLAGVLAGLATLPLRRTSLQEAWHILRVVPAGFCSRVLSRLRSHAGPRDMVLRTGAM